MAEGARLESVYALIRIEGSNPSLSASSSSTIFGQFPCLLSNVAAVEQHDYLPLKFAPWGFSLCRGGA